ncbi:hypothetical protein L6R53_33265 [Myxococcota bacterium]|nr:hypothetical protein [Myxococcota bacterium]
MLSLSILFALLACAEPDTDDDTGPGVTTDGGATSDGGGTTTDGGTSTAELCREVETPFDESTAPASGSALSSWHEAILAAGAASWSLSLDGSELSEVNVGGQWTGELSIVDWVADGSEEAVHPCRDGPATRAWVDLNFWVVPGEASGTLPGALDTNGVDYWFTRMRTATPVLSDDWQALVDVAEEAAGHPEATTFMSLDNPEVLTIGSETATWSQYWWSGPLIEYGRIPSSLPLD